MQVKAHIKHLRMSPKKARLVIDLVRGMDATAAEHQLRFLNKVAAKPVLKLLQSAIANAENNFKLKKSDLFIKDIRADEGVSLRRFTPKAHGRATTIHRQSSHLRIALDVKSSSAVNTPKPETRETQKEAPENVSSASKTGTTKAKESKKTASDIKKEKQ